MLIPSICCLHKSTALEELYLEKADSVAITTYLLAHTLKHLNNLRVLALPKQCDDDVASIIGIILHIFHAFFGSVSCIGPNKCMALVSGAKLIACRN